MGVGFSRRGAVLPATLVVTAVIIVTLFAGATPGHWAVQVRRIRVFLPSPGDVGDERRPAGSSPWSGHQIRYGDRRDVVECFQPDQPGPVPETTHEVPRAGCRPRRRRRPVRHGRTAHRWRRNRTPPYRDSCPSTARRTAARSRPSGGPASADAPAPTQSAPRKRPPSVRRSTAVGKSRPAPPAPRPDRSPVAAALEPPAPPRRRRDEGRSARRSRLAEFDRDANGLRHGW